ncbi:DUF4440 domain-containing protein, partial [Salmonella enterica subsp. enterica serovar Poona]
QQPPGQADPGRCSTVILNRERRRLVSRHLHETTVTA